jgi:hypothetical protein
MEITQKMRFERIDPSKVKYFAAAAQSICTNPQRLWNAFKINSSKIPRKSKSQYIFSFSFGFSKKYFHNNITCHGD